MFFQNLSRFTHQIAAIEGGQQITYEQLSEAIEEVKSQIQDSLEISGQVIFVKAHNGISTLIVYLAILDTEHCAVLLDPNIKGQALFELIVRFQPGLIAHCGVNQSIWLEAQKPRPESISLGSVGVLLSTSGSTGSAKHVALSKHNLNANTQSICRCLPIQTTDVTLCSLPFHYSYGLSVINSHLNMGACCVFSDASPIAREYWQLFEHHQITSFAGVPFSYELLLRLKFTQKELPHLRYFTQAGGKLASEHVIALGQYARDSDKLFFIMYGQTEAAARMAYLAPEKVLQSPNSIGQPIPNGEFKLVAENGSPISAANQIGEIHYAGPNVMLGYVTSRQDILAIASAKKTQPAWLATGDLGYRDEHGDFYISGRKSRFVKLTGQRIDLDDCERLLQQAEYTVMCTGNDSRLIIGVLKGDDDFDYAKKIKMLLHEGVGVHPSKIKVITLDYFPLNTNQKVNYPALLEMAQDANHEQ